MILRDKPGILALLFAVRGSVLPVIAPQLMFVALFSTAVVAIDRFVWTLPHVQAAPLAVFGVALSLFLGFRNNAAYDRWWEARRLWGPRGGNLPPRRHRPPPPPHRDARLPAPAPLRPSRPAQ
jgi:putative membrane protein